MKTKFIGNLRAKFALFVLILLAVDVFAKVDYHLNKSENPTADELEAYELITAAMDSAVNMYNRYTHLSKHIEVHYNTGVQTADASYNGTMRFGSNRSYMRVRTAMHEMGHIMGMGTTDEYRNMLEGGVFKGEKAQAKLKELTGDPDAVLKGDGQHFWPYGLNYDSELHSEEDLIIHCQIVEAMYQDIFKESFYKEGYLKSLKNEKCMGKTAENTLELMECGGEGTLVKIWAVGDPVAYRIEFGDRVLDVPNESTAAGVVLSTYYWNGGAHQKYEILSAEGEAIAGESGVYLRNLKSGLYLTPSGMNVVQAERSGPEEDAFWLLLDTVGGDSPQPPADSLHQAPADSDSSATAVFVGRGKALPSRNIGRPLQEFDALGRGAKGRSSRPRARAKLLFLRP